MVSRGKIAVDKCFRIFESVFKYFIGLPQDHIWKLTMRLRESDSKNYNAAVVDTTDDYVFARYIVEK